MCDPTSSTMFSLIQQTVDALNTDSVPQIQQPLDALNANSGPQIQQPLDALNADSGPQIQQPLDALNADSGPHMLDKNIPTDASTKPFACTHCDKRFTQIKNLSRHVHTHSEKPYVCTQCGKKFMFSKCLELHVSRNHRTNTFEKKFSLSSEVKHIDVNLAYHSVSQLLQSNQLNSGSSSVNEAVNMTHMNVKEEIHYDLGFEQRSMNNENAKSNSATHSEIDRAILSDGGSKIKKEPEEFSGESVCDPAASTLSTMFLPMQQTGDELNYLNTDFVPLYTNCVCSRFTLEKHLNLLTQSGGKHACKDCGFKRYSQFQVGKKPFACSHCGERFTSSGSVEQHFRTHTGDEPFACSSCSMRFRTSSSLMSHLRSLHPDIKLYACKYCGQRFPETVNLKAHLLTDELCRLRRQLSCTHCSKTFLMSCHLQEHLLCHTAREKPFFSCELCGKRFSKKEYVRDHNKRVHRQGFECTQCSKRFVQPRGLEAHLLTHASVKPFACTFCSMRFTDLGSLDVHLLTHAGEEIDQLEEHKIREENCFVKTDDCLDIKNVYQSLTQQLPEICEISDSGSSADGDEMIEEEPYACTLCSMSFTMPLALKIHLATHSEKKSLACPHCNMRFSGSGSLEIHLLTHTGESYACTYCSMRFTAFESLEAHLITHIGEMPIEESSNLVRHTGYEEIERLGENCEIKVEPEEFSDAQIIIESVGSASSAMFSREEQTRDVLNMDSDDAVIHVIAPEFGESSGSENEDCRFLNDKDWKLLVDPIVELFPLKHPVTSSIKLYG